MYSGAHIADRSSVNERSSAVNEQTLQSINRLRGSSRGRRWTLTRTNKVALFGVFTAILLGAVIPSVDSMPLASAGIGLRWWMLAPSFALAELAVVHMRFRRDAHSFSLSDVPLVIGFFLASTYHLVAAMIVGILIALSAVRRQRGVKLWFNLVGFTAQAVVGHAVFKAIVGTGDLLGMRGWVGAFVAVAAAFAVADALVTGAIWLTGGAIKVKELGSVIGFGLVAGSINTGLALLLVTLFVLRPESAWLALVPTAILFTAYRAYTNQRDERARIEALYELTLALHAAPIIEDAVAAAAAGARELFEAESVHVVITSDGPLSYRTVASADGTEVMAPIFVDWNTGIWPRLVSEAEGSIIKVEEQAEWNGLVPAPNRMAMVSPLMAGDRHTGFILVADPQSDVGTFTDRDLKILETLAGRLGVSLENGRLEDSLSEVTRLKERLEELVASKDQFIASVSHELRTPLTGIVGLAQELRNNREFFGADELDEFLGHIYEQSTELGAIIEDLLVAARADIGTLVVRPVDTELLSELDSIVASHARKVGAAGQRLDPVVRGGDRRASADPMRLRQIVRNLITNALRYGGANSWVEIAQVDDTVEVRVWDDGEGVPPDSLEEIFQPYGRGSGGQANPLSVGLGLSVSLQLARLMGGDLVYRRIGDQTCFVVLLPAVPVEAARTA
jgi:signal transduction histidine kinase